VIFLGPFISSRGVSIILVLEKENLDRMRQADPFDLQLKDYPLPRDISARDLDIVIAYEEDASPLLALHRGGDSPRHGCLHRAQSETEARRLSAAAEGALMIQRYPLTWPEGWKRTESWRRRHGQFNRKETRLDAYGPGRHAHETKKLSIGDAIARVFRELEALGVKHVQEDAVVSTNLRVNMSGIPRGDQGDPSDPRCAVYWELKGVRQCMAIDQYRRVPDNLAAIAATLEAMRAIERHGGTEILQRAFTGFAQLPEGSGATIHVSWRARLRFRDNQVVTMAEVEESFRVLAKAVHPDQGGNDDSMRALLEARNLARVELGGK
jgi:hypothetical protein